MRARRSGIWVVVGSVCIAVVGATLALALSSPAPVIIGGTRPQPPAVSGGRVVWSDTTYGNSDIFLYDSGTRSVSRITTDKAEQVDPAISGDIVVWSDRRTGKAVIRARNLATGAEFDVSPNVSDQVRPAISGTFVVWEDYRNNYSPAIYGRDVAGGTERRIASSTSSKKRPKVAGNIVVWEDYSVAAGAGDVRSFDLVTGVTSVVAGTAAAELLPDTDGRYIVWTQPADGGMDIMAFDTTTGTSRKIAGQRGEQTFPAITGGVAYWTDNSAGSRLHIDTYDLSTNRPGRFDDASTRDVTGIDADGGSTAWLAKRGAGWQVVARVPATVALSRSVASLVPRPVARLTSLRRSARVRPTALSANATLPLRVVSTSVRPGQLGVDAKKPLIVRFSKQLDPSAANLAHIYLVDQSGRRVRARLTYDRRTATVTVRTRGNLGRGGYTLVVDESLVDSTGGQIADSSRVSFATVRTLAVPLSPAYVRAKVSGLTSVTVSWNNAGGAAKYYVYRSNSPTQVADYTTQATLVATVASGTVTSTTVAVRADEASSAYTYNYVVVADDGAGNLSAQSLNAAPDPHGVSSSLTDTCRQCHSVHGATSPYLGSASAADCYECHGSTSATPLYGANSSFDTQARFQDDSVIATGPTRAAGPAGTIHRSAALMSNGHECDACHTPHRKPYDPTPSLSFNRMLRTQIATPVPDVNPSSAYRYNTDASAVGNQLCFDCHGNGTTDNAMTLIGLVAGDAAYTNAGGDHRTNYANTAHGDPSRLATPTTSMPNPSIQCLACHDEHGSTVPRLLGRFDPASGTSRITSGSLVTTLTGNDNSVCFGCHTYGTPGSTAASEDASGYPIRGTWPGKALWAVPYNATTHTGSFHATGTVTWSGAGKPAGDCKNCHVIHGADYQNPRDILRRNAVTDGTTYGPTDLEFCFKCHDGSIPTATNMKQWFPTAVGGTAAQNANTRFGHKTRSAGKLPAGSAVPCYDCHNPHGSGTGYGLMVVTMSEGVTITVGDASGEITMTPGSPAADVRNFCFTCHSTSDSGKGWNGSAMRTVRTTDTVEGISRYSTSSGERLRLPAASGHREADTQSCYLCHGNDYSAADANNVHNPSGGLSLGGSPCYGCHGQYRDMDAASPNKLNAYHHVVGTSTVTYNGDIAPMTGAYPTSTADVYCVSCHTDHNYFNSAKAANLRSGIGLAGSTATNTDFIASGSPSYGICVSCHSVQVVKDTANQASSANSATADPTTSTPAIGGAGFDASKHDYSVVSTFSTGMAFNANCSKCHTDGLAKPYQQSADEFGTHLSTTISLLDLLGTFPHNPAKEDACFACHRSAGDRFGTATMSAAAKNTQTEFGMLSRHDLTKVACANCHNVHAASDTAPAADPDNIYNAAAVNTTTTINTFCLKCHDGTPPAKKASPTAFVPYTVSANATANVGTYYTSAGHGVAEPGTPFTGRANTGYATGYTDVTADWSNEANALGAPDGAVASSPSDNGFEMRSTFTFPSTMTSIEGATLTVRSRANGNWGAATGGTHAVSDVLYPNSEVQAGSWTAAGAATTYEAVDDPAGSYDQTTYITATGGTEYRAGCQAPAVPSNATNITVSVIWVGYDNSTTQTFTSRLCLGTTWSNFATTRNPGTGYTQFTDTWTTQPGGAAWTVAAANSITGLGIDKSSTTTAARVTQMYVQIDYTVPNTYDDTWAIQYTTDGSTWNDIVAANSTAEASLTDHTINLAGILTPANAADFAVRIAGAAVNATDNVGTIDWDASTLQLTYSGSDPGAVRADCRDCHEQHGSTLRDLLKTTVDGQSVPAYSDTSDQAQCLACHRAGGMAGRADIARYFPSSAYGTAPSSMTRSGHRTKTAGTLAAGSALPCRQCHNPHGGADSGYMLAVRTQVSAGVDVLIGATPGQLAMAATQQTPGNAVNVRRFCFSCHTSSDATPQGWNGSADAAVASGCQVLGISRTAGVLRVPTLPNGVKGHAIADTTYSCYLCHGDDFTQATSVNVHNPASGESRGKIPCYICHTVYRDNMEDGSGTEVGSARTSSFHHVLGSATRNGDTTTYPTSAGAATDVYCLSCHVDHDLFSPFVNAAYKRGSNLRTGIGASAPASTADATNTDFIVGSGGVCLACHNVELDKDTTNQATTSKHTPSLGAADYAASAHEYDATSTFTDASSFRADCAKCHDGEIDGGGMERGSATTGFQTSANKFSVHYSSADRILAAMGVALPATEESVCYKCHSHSSGGLKTVDGKDWYNQASMNATSEALASIMTTTYAHDVASYLGVHLPSSTDETQGYISANKHVECADCHDVHTAASGRHATGGNAVSATIKGVSGVEPVYTANSNWTAPTSYTATSSSTKEYQICLKCHSTANTNVTSWGGTGAASWTDVGLEFNPGNGSYHPVVAALPAADPSISYGSSQLQAGSLRARFTSGGWTSGGFTSGSTMYCSDCHVSGDAASFGPHGSGVKWMLRGPNQAWPYTTRAANGTNATTNYRLHNYMQAAMPDGPDGLFCNNCHVLPGPVGNAHGTFDKHGAMACVSCHVRVPHGSKTSRLLAAVGSGTYPGNMPLRMTSNGQGSLAGSTYLRYVKKPAAGSDFGIGNCTTNNCGTHGTGTITNADAIW